MVTPISHFKLSKAFKSFLKVSNSKGFTLCATSRLSTLADSKALRLVAPNVAGLLRVRPHFHLVFTELLRMLRVARGDSSPSPISAFSAVSNSQGNSGLLGFRKVSNLKLHNLKVFLGAPPPI